MIEVSEGDPASVRDMSDFETRRLRQTGKEMTITVIYSENRNGFRNLSYRIYGDDSDETAASLCEAIAFAIREYSRLKTTETGSGQ